MIGLRVGRYVLSASELARFWSHVRVGNRQRCWPFRGKSGGRYGVFRIWRDGKRVHIRAHRIALAWRLRKPLRLSTHDCDRCRCCNPWHLQNGTNSSNLRESWARGRRRAA